MQSSSVLMLPRPFQGGFLCAVLANFLTLGGGLHCVSAEPEPRAPSPGSGGSAAAYESSAALGERYRGKVLNERIRIHWLDEGASFWFREASIDGHAYRRVVTSSGEVSPLFDHEALASGLSEATESTVNPAALPLDDLDFRAGKEMRFRAFDARWKVALPELKIERLAEENDEEAAEEPGRRRDSRRGESGARRYEAVSPDGEHVAFFRDDNVFIRKTGDGTVIQLSNDGTEQDGYGAPVYWAPDSQRLAVWKTRRGKERLVHYIDSAPDDQLQPEHFTRRYAKPGDEIDVRYPHLFTTDWTSRQTQPDESLLPNPFVTRQLEWDEDGRAIRFEYIERGFGVHRVMELHAETGKTRVIVDESSETFIDAYHKGYRHDLPDTAEILWTSERDGWNHLYLIDERTGETKRQVTRGPWVFRGVEHVDDEARSVIFRASGYYPDQDPYFIHYFRVELDGGKVTPLTSANGSHSAQWSPNRDYLVATWSRVNRAPVHELRSAVDGRLIASLGEADLSRLKATGWEAPEVFVSKDRDGAYDLWGLIFRPTQFDPKESYPVIEHIYAGPHSAFVPKTFRSYHRLQSMAELGFIVVKLDAKGTSHRSRDFHHFCHKNLGDSGFPDRIAWMKSAARDYPQMDLTRVGIYGGSAGGQSALRALLAHGDFYRAAAADCGCHDNRMDKIWWNELWMDWPVGPHYEEQSNVTQAHRLQGKLLLTVGELDTNVDPASTMQVVDALIKADKDFEMLVVPGANHGVGESPYAARRRKDFFVRHLLGVEPRHSAEVISHE